MSKILITGMTASQCSVTANEKALSFAGLLNKALVAQGHTVVMSDADFSWSTEALSYYDSVVVGIAPIMSLTANSSYGALHVLSLMWNDPRLTLLVDAPKPEQIVASLKAITLNKELLTKQFYSNRKGYQYASKPENAQELHKAISNLLTSTWPRTIYPRLPWSDDSYLAQCLPSGAANIIGLNLDAFAFAPAVNYSSERISRWVADDVKSSWTQKTLPTLAYPAAPMRLNKSWNDKAIEDQMRHSIGALITPYKKHTWWSYRYVQAINTGTPVATEWRDSAKIGAGWAVLASGIESMSPDRHAALALAQANQYRSSVPTMNEAIKQLHDGLGLLSTSKRGQ